eukprot:1161803-Pelagomonas_calceolata.AAC.17
MVGALFVSFPLSANIRLNARRFVLWLWRPGWPRAITLIAGTQAAATSSTLAPLMAGATAMLASHSISSRVAWVTRATRVTFSSSSSLHACSPGSPAGPCLAVMSVRTCVMGMPMACCTTLAQPRAPSQGHAGSPGHAGEAADKPPTMVVTCSQAPKLEAAVSARG